MTEQYTQPTITSPTGKVWHFPQDTGRYLGLATRNAQPCELGHASCAAWFDGPCSNGLEAQDEPEAQEEPEVQHYHYFSSSMLTWNVAEDLGECITAQIRRDKADAKSLKCGLKATIYKVDLPISEDYRIENYVPKLHYRLVHLVDTFTTVPQKGGRKK